jgi:hypothetical protein
MKSVLICRDAAGAFPGRRKPNFWTEAMVARREC